MTIRCLLFDDFETLDLFGPVEIFGRMPEYRMSYISAEGGRVTSAQGVQLETEPLTSGAAGDILLVPGGQGTRKVSLDSGFTAALRTLAEESLWCLTVCTGSALLAKTGLLDGRRATSNKRAFEWAASMGPAVNWVRSARWTADGKYYTSSGVSAGIDMALGFIADRLGHSRAAEIAAHIEYIWNSDRACDPFAAGD